MEENLEHERIREIYRQWHAGRTLPQYVPLRPEILEQSAARARTFADLFQQTVGLDMAALRVLDVGCGTGRFLRQLIDWGATPANLTGTELLPERLEAARLKTAQGVYWHLGGLGSLSNGNFDLVTAHTVFTSIADNTLRKALAADMWRAMRPGGWGMVFDFRYNNPHNQNVRKLTRAELAELWPARQHFYRSLVLAPPVARRMASLPHLISELLTALVPPLRSHFVYMFQKDHCC